MPSTAASTDSASENVNFLWEDRLVGTGVGERSSSVVEILTLNSFSYCLQHNVDFGHGVRGADSKP